MTKPTKAKAAKRPRGRPKKTEVEAEAKTKATATKKTKKKKVGTQQNTKDHLAQRVLHDLLKHFTESEIEREYIFHPSRKWRLDFAVPNLKIGVEVHGGIWIGGRHTRGHGFQNDREKMNEAAVRDWLILELTDRAINSDQCEMWIRQAKSLKESEAASRKESFLSGMQAELTIEEIEAKIKEIDNATKI